MPIEKNLIDEIEQIETLTNYDLTEISETETPQDENFFKEPEIKEEKKKRGRPSKTPTPPPASKPFGMTETDEQTFIDQEDNEEFIKADTGTIDDTKISLNNLLPGDTLIIVLDKLMSVVLPLALNNLAGTKLKPSDLKLTADEKKQLKPSIEACAKTIPINFSNPWIALGITALAVYGAKTVDKINFDNIDADDFAPKTERRGRPRKNN
jgi:hypothetical protein